MVLRALAPERVIRSRTCADVIQPCHPVFRCWTKTELSISAAGQKDRGSGGENVSSCAELLPRTQVLSGVKSRCEYLGPSLGGHGNDVKSKRKIILPYPTQKIQKRMTLIPERASNKNQALSRYAAKKKVAGNEV